MTRYETIVSLGDNFLKLIQRNIIPISLMDWKVYYEAYLNDIEHQRRYCSKVRATEAVETVSANYDVTRRHLFRIVAFMEEEMG